ncbi:MAG: chitobiase/beta-hexosaminidase C-terminal domain-containing protein, partial [Terracidiphilus sp.]
RLATAQALLRLATAQALLRLATAQALLWMTRWRDSLLGRRLVAWIHDDMTKSGMSMVSKQLRISQTQIRRPNGPRVIRTFQALLLTLIVGAFASPAPARAITPSGIAWRVRGIWRVDGASGSIRTGDAIPPRALLLPNNPETPHSIVVLLPDGQRILYECFTEEQCERGFRVPPLYEKPTSFAIELLARIRSVLVRDRDKPPTKPEMNRQLPREEIVAALGPGNRISVAGLAASLPDGHYSYEAIDGGAHGTSDSKWSTFEKKGPSIRLALPSTGAYDFIVRDNLKRPRIDLFIAAVKPAEAPELMNSFRHAQQRMKEWNDDYAGWPIDDFQRAYLESVILKIAPQYGQEQEMATTRVPRPGTTAEPAFSPEPGVFEGNVMVQLRCVTPGAAIHYTVDNSQPVKDSPVYGSPISVKRTELTIKAFASSVGEKDSAVVTGIFRIKQ